MGGASTFVSLLCLIGFFAATWTASKVSRVVGVPALILEIGTGILLGPRVLQLVDPQYGTCERRSFPECAAPDNFERLVEERRPLGPTLGRIANMDYCPQDMYLATTALSTRSARGAHNSTANASLLSASNATSNGTNATHRKKHRSTGRHLAKDTKAQRAGAGATGPDYEAYRECLERNCEADLARQCERTPGLFTIIGHAGVGLLIFENAMHLSIDRLKSVGAWSFVVAFMGAVIPMITGCALIVLYGEEFSPNALLAGNALVPTGVSFASRLLRRAEITREDFSQVIITAALLDNLLALLLYDIFFSLGGPLDGFRSVACPVIGSVLVALALAAAVFFWPRVLQQLLLPKVSQQTNRWSHHVPAADEALLFIMMGALVFWAWIMFLLGNFLWGCFIAGMSFACFNPPEQTHNVWARQAKVLTTWMVRIFFACTVAFSIPVEILFHGEAFWKGTILGFFPCILAKAVCACFLGEARFVVGWAMVGRGELAFFIAQSSANAGLMNQDTFCIVLWALLWADVLVPFAFSAVVHRNLLGLQRHHQQDFTTVVAGTGKAGKAVAVEDAPAKDRLGSLDGIDLEDACGRCAQQEDMERAEGGPAAAGETSAPPRRDGGGLLCCLFFREVVTTH